LVNASRIGEWFVSVGGGLNERSRGVFTAAKAGTGGYVRIAAASLAAGIGRSTFGRGL
jgi:hypothetical protein